MRGRGRWVRRLVLGGLVCVGGPALAAGLELGGAGPLAVPAGQEVGTLRWQLAPSATC